MIKHLILPHVDMPCYCPSTDMDITLYVESILKKRSRIKLYTDKYMLEYQIMLQNIF